MVEADPRRGGNHTEENTLAPPSKESSVSREKKPGTQQRNDDITPLQLNQRRESNMSKSPIQRRQNTKGTVDKSQRSGNASQLGSQSPSRRRGDGLSNTDGGTSRRVSTLLQKFWQRQVLRLKSTQSMEKLESIP